MPAAQLVLITCPPATAEALASLLVEQKLAACVNVLPGLRSVYRWQGAVERADESLLIAKTTVAGYAALERAVLQNHPYELPEIVAVDTAQGLPGWLLWLTESVA